MSAPVRRRSWVAGPPEVIEPVGPQRRTVALLAGVVAVLAVAVLGLTDQWRGTGAIDLPRIELPDVSARSGDDARGRLESLGFVVQLLYQPNENVAKGTVFAQVPRAGAKVPQGDVVSVLVSDGPLGLQVPGIEGQQQADGVALLQRSGLGAEVVPTFDESVRPGQILGTEPAAGQRVAEGGVVRLLVSNGPAPRTVPDVLNQNSAEALLRLGRAGLAPGRITRTVRTDLPAGTVFAAEPAPGAAVPKDTPVALTVAIAEPRVIVPYLVGLLEGTANAVAREAGLGVSIVAVPVAPGDPTAGRVVAQGTPPQADVLEGTTVQLSVAVAIGQPPPDPAASTSTTAPGG